MTAPNVGYARLLDHAQERYAPVLTGRALAIDVERAREVVGRLEAVADEVGELVSSLALMHVTAPGADVVSRNAARQGSKMVIAARSYLETWHRDLMNAIVSLRQQVHDYESADSRNAARA